MDGPWQGTFPTNFGVENGLSPGLAWGLRIALVYAYVFVLLAWLWRGYRIFVEHYRYADWTPRDDVVRRLRDHRWGQFGFVVVFMFLTMAIFAPAMSPTTVSPEYRASNSSSWSSSSSSSSSGSVGSFARSLLMDWYVTSGEGRGADILSPPGIPPAGRVTAALSIEYRPPGDSPCL